MLNAEVLAPAGTIDHVIAALEAGADSVYVGLKGFSARPDEWSFSLEDISVAKQLAFDQEKKIYVAINAEYRNNQEKLFPKVREKLTEIGVDALIVGDYGLLHTLRQLGNTIPLHASTLLGIYNAEGVRLLQEQFGINRLVLNTSLFIDEINDLHNLCPNIELEIIAHGGICFNDNRRCRLPHYLYKGEFCVGCKQLYEKFFIEQKPSGEDKHSNVLLQTRTPVSSGIGELLIWAPEVDLSKNVGLFMRLGVSSFKIEGRTRTSEYVALSTAKMRAAVDKAIEDSSLIRSELNPFDYDGPYSRQKKHDK